LPQSKRGRRGARKTKRTKKGKAPIFIYFYEIIKDEEPQIENYIKTRKKEE